mmetsp:Transcript_41118/g.96030  ORF Transcript_41118/g.96030 Transcript_41118/m.96030 type:complete len:171 (-) Transcript_41118:712-1224(-)
MSPSLNSKIHTEATVRATRAHEIGALLFPSGRSASSESAGLAAYFFFLALAGAFALACARSESLPLSSPPRLLPESESELLPLSESESLPLPLPEAELLPSSPLTAFLPSLSSPPTLPRDCVVEATSVLASARAASLTADLFTAPPARALSRSLTPLLVGGDWWVTEPPF